jgi:hypothetical protein
VIDPRFIDPRDIRPPDHARRHTDRDPLVVRHTRSSRYRFELAMGFTAYERAMRAGAQLVHVFIRAEDAADPLDRLNDILTLRLTDPIEEALAYDEALTRLGVGQRELSAMIGIPQPHISKRLKLLRLSRDAREAVRTKQLPIEHALQLASC